jgi:hypothetical protein
MLVAPKARKCRLHLTVSNQFWSNKDIEAFMSLICINEDASTRAYLQHWFFTWISKTYPDQKTKRVNLTGKQNDKRKESLDRITLSSTYWLISAIELGLLQTTYML